MKYTLDSGINLIDTAAMCFFPGKPETQGSTETLIGNWFAKNGNCNKVLLATKIAGLNRNLEHIRNPLDFSKKPFEDAINKSLKRLQTDYIDLY